jgi:hypothetical protein
MIEPISRGYAGTGFKNVKQACVSGSHKRRQKCFGIAIEPGAKKLRNGQNNMAIGDAGEHASADEIGPSVGIDLGARETEG